MPEEWFAPHFEFRFPKLGDFTVRNVEVELRSALEPWHVMGEQGAPGGTVRYVDSSLERMQVKVRGMTDTRHVLTVNGVTLPLHPTGTVGEFVAGVRYRAWWLPSNLHPSIGVACAADLRSGGHLDGSLAWAARATTWRIRAAAIM